MNATLGHDQRFEFERNQNLIRLDIPRAGITTSDKAWRITALGPPVVGLCCYHFLDKTAYTLNTVLTEEWVPVSRCALSFFLCCV